MPKTQTRGWQLTLTHPTTGKTVSLDVLENPEFAPSLNSLVEARIPVRRSEDLLEWPSGTTVDLTYNGDSQPVDELEDIEQEADRTIIVAEGGIELDERLKTEFREERRHVAAKNIIDEETPYTADVDTPDFERQDNVVLQSLSTEQEFEDEQNDATETPDVFDLSGDSIETFDSLYIVEAEDASLEGANDVITGDIYSGGEAVTNSDLGEAMEFTFSADYIMREGDWGVFFRGTQASDDGQSTRVKIEVNGDLAFDNLTGPGVNEPDWQIIQPDDILEQKSIGGSVTVRVEVDNVQDDDIIIDLFGFFDGRFDYDFEEVDLSTVDRQHLNGPETKPDAVDYVFNDAITPFVIEEATGTVDIDDTSNEQALALSSDRGGSFTTESNTDTISISDVETPQVRLRATLSRWEPDGPRDQTPRLGYGSQTISSTEIETDLRLESLLIDEAFDDSIENVLNDIAGDEYLWSYRIDNGTPTVAWTQPGQRESSQDPDIEANVRVSKNLKTWDAVTIKGSSQSVSGEVFSSSTTFQELDEQNIVSGSEAVTDRNDDDTYRRGEDYEMRYNDGEVRRLSQGSMGTGSFEIDYRYEVEGTFPEDYSGNRELVETIPGVVSERQARQLAYIILEVDPAVSLPSFSADVLLPRSESVFDPLEALSLDRLGLPDDATPLEIREEPQQTPDGTALRLGARDPLASLSRLSNKLQKVSRRS